MRPNPFTSSRSKFKRIAAFALIILVLAIGAYYLRNFLSEKKDISDAQKSVEDIPTVEQPKTEAPKTETPAETPPAPVEEALPESALIKMSFTTQSPLAVWDATQEDACEEASLIMVVNYLNKTSIGPREEAEKKILDLIEWEKGNNYGPSVTVKELKQIASDYYQMGGKVHTGVSIDDIKKQITLGNPVIIPAAGKILPNPNFRNGGPNYHMLVVKGYDKNGFITNDPGTRKGENFRYTFDDLYKAIHDWDAGNILNGQKAFLIINK